MLQQRWVRMSWDQPGECPREPQLFFLRAAFFPGFAAFVAAFGLS
jgi:hypothetical protein